MRLRTIGAFLSLVCASSAVSAQDVTFRASLVGTTSDGANGIVLADFDRDGTLEIATLHGDNAKIDITMLFRDPPIEFALASSVDAGNVPAAMVAGTFDDDETLDFVVTSVSEGSLRFIRGASSGDFDFSFDSPGPPLCVGSFAGDPPMCNSLSPLSLAAGDLNNDGNLDVVVGNQGSSEEATGEVVVLRGEGDGTFTSVRILTPQVGTVGVAIGRIDSGTTLDIVAINSGSDTVSTFFGRGDFVFDVGPNLATEPNAAPSGVAVGDLNGDGADDIVTADFNGDTASIFLSNGNRTFAPRVSYPVGTKPSAAAIALLDGDDRPDIVVTNKLSSDVSVLYGNGEGGVVQTRNFVGELEPIAVALGDLRGDDGKLDIVTAHAVAPDTIAALFSLGDSFSAVEDLPAGSEPRSVAAGDVNNDGYPDLVVVHRDGEVVALRSTVDGFAPNLQVADLPAGLDLALVDLNADGKLDVAALDDEGRNVAIIRGLGSGRFSGVVQNLTTGDQPTAMTTGDFNGDGRPDVAVVSIGPPGQVGVFRAQENGTFAARQTTQVPCTLPDPECNTPVPVAIAAADINCDGNDDLLVANRLSSTLAVLISGGNGSFTVQNQLPESSIGRGPSALVVADFNRDGQADVAVGSGIVTGGGEGVRLLYGNRTPCNGTFRVPPADEAQYRFGDNLISALTAHDFNNDALIDVVGAYQVLNGVQLFAAVRVDQQMLTVFDSQQIANVSRMPFNVATGDFNGDGLYDVATANGDLNASNVSVVTNALTSTVRRGDSNGDGDVSAADLVRLALEIADGDGKQAEDVALRNPQSQRGVDANGDGRVDIQDEQGTAAWIFRGA